MTKPPPPPPKGPSVVDAWLAAEWAREARQERLAIRCVALAGAAFVVAMIAILVFGGCSEVLP